MDRIIINPKEDLIFDYKVEEACKSCKRYGKGATCPPYIRDIDYYRKLLPTYQYCEIYYEKFPIKKNKNWIIDGKKSSLTLSNFLVQKRNKLFAEGHYFVAAFGAGSCKVCDKCTIPCRFPDKSLIPLEATGLYVVEIMRQNGVEVGFPVKKHFYRIGAIFYD